MCRYSAFWSVMWTRNPRNLASRTALLAKNCPPDTSIEVRALYLPSGSIPSLAAKVLAHVGGAN